MEILLAIDGGATRTRCMAFDREGRLIGQGAGGPSNHLQFRRETVAASLSQAIGGALAESGGGSVALVCAGLAGVDFDGAGGQEAAAIFQNIGFPKVALYGDMVIAHRGALAGSPGVLAAAGTGAVFLGVGASGEVLKAGGWGPLYGDEGSAGWIARRGLAAAARAHDGRGPATALLGAISEALHLDRFRDSIARIYTGAMEASGVAALSRVVCQVAEQSDPVALSILQEAGEELALGAAALVRRLTPDSGGCLVSYHGAMLESCPLVFDRFRSSLQLAAPNARLVPPRFEPALGAYLLGCETLGWKPRYVASL